MFEVTPSDKMRFRALGELPEPGSCLVCGSGTREEGYVDIGVWVDFVGNCLLCHTCLTQAAELIGMRVPEEVLHIQRLAENATTENTAIKAQLEAANERLSAYDLVLSGISSSTGAVIDSGAGPGSALILETPEQSDDGEQEAFEFDLSGRESSSAGSPKPYHGESEGEQYPSFKL